MTTVLDPSGTPTIAYNRSGTTIVRLTGGFTPYRSPEPNAPIGNDGIDIPYHSETTVVLADTNTVYSGTNTEGWNQTFRLPAGADIGDVVEFVTMSGSGPSVFPQIGEAILPHAVSDGTNNSAVSGGARFRKISSSTWVSGP